MNIIDNAIDALRFKDTIFYKENSDLQYRYNALEKLSKEYPSNEEIKSELYIIRKGLEGENEIAYQLKKSSIGMYVLRDIIIKHEDLTAQIDYVIITPYYTYFVECKNLVGNITINEKGDFIRTLTIDGKKIVKGMPSPLRQVEAQREVLKKKWNSSANIINKLLSKKFEDLRKVLVVAANPETIINTTKAPKSIKYKVLRADALVRQIEYDLNSVSRMDFDSKKEMELRAENYLKLSSNDRFDYYWYYKNKFVGNNLKDKLIELRSNRAKSLNLPKDYVFTDEELDKLIKYTPFTIDNLKKILPPIKVKVHGEAIIDIIKNS